MIHKSFLRMITCNALLYRQGNQYSTIAENRVYDTRLDDLDARIEGGDIAPSISIYTGEGLTGINGQNTNHIAGYHNTKLQMELTIFGGWSGFGIYGNQDRFLSFMINIFEQQVFDALFKAQNPQAQKFRDTFQVKGDLQSITLNNSDADRKIFEQRIEIDIQLPEQYNSSVYPQDRVDILDYYPEYVNLIPSDMRTELEKVLAMNDASKLEILNSKLTQDNAPILTIQNEWTDD